MERRRAKKSFLFGGVTALYGAVSACSSAYGTAPDAIVPPNPAPPTDGGAGQPEGAAEPSTPPPCNGATDLASDARHCGRCGHDCLDGACDAGQCQAAEVAAGLPGVQYLRAAGLDLFATTTDGMVRVAKAGGPPAALFSGAGALGIAVTETHALCVTNVGIQRVPFGGGSPRLTPVTQVDEVAVDGAGAIYVCGVGGYDVRRYEPNGTVGTTVVKDVRQCESLVVVGTDLFAGGKQIVRAALDGSAKEGTALGTVSARRIAVDAAWVYSIQAGSASIHRTSREGGAISSLVAMSPESVMEGDLAIDETHVYWTTGTKAGSVYRAPKAGGAVELIATGLALPKGIAVDDVAVYWSERNASKIMRRAK